MRTEKLNLEDLIPEATNRISIPPDKNLHEKFLKNFPGIPPIVTDREKVILSGYDSFDYLADNNVDKTDVLISDLGRKEGLFLAVNSKLFLYFDFHW